MHFEDHFSRQAATYAQFRPRYPTELYAFLANQTIEQSLAWDCATGSGQAALGLVEHFEQVIGTDASADQISHAGPHERITYRVEPAEKTSLESHSIDLVTVATAVHWFDLDAFYREVRRVLKPGGIIAVWGYYRPVISPQIDTQVIRYEMDILGEYWPERIVLLRNQYRSLPFPFEEIPAPEFAMQAEWDMSQVLGFFNSWSATTRYREEHGHHPLEKIWADFTAAWGGENQKHSVRWPLFVRAGRIGN
ncbi:MAG TPA: class I SAM-dependent methyltransferase [Anaerolinea sp.]|nr:class I SAM-dependent methyltransferase [Anaerolinea sp.]